MAARPSMRDAASLEPRDASDSLEPRAGYSARAGARGVAYGFSSAIAPPPPATAAAGARNAGLAPGASWLLDSSVR
jgi:hypothetical protein